MCVFFLFLAATNNARPRPIDALHFSLRSLDRLKLGPGLLREKNRNRCEVSWVVEDGLGGGGVKCTVGSLAPILLTEGTKLGYLVRIFFFFFFF